MSAVLGRVSREWRAFLSSVEFLTRIPVWRRKAYDPADLPRSTTYFPVVGVIVGASGGLVFTLASLLWPPALAVLLAVAATVRLTGAFHEDAVADLFDGFGGGWNREQIFAIMKDSRVGAYGVVGLLFVILAKLLALTGIATVSLAHGTSILGTSIAMTQVMIAGHVLGRWSSLPLIWHYPYARPDSATAQPGTGKPFASSVTRGRLIAGTAITLLIVVAVLRHRALVVVAVALTVTMVCGRYFNRRIGGITGDTLGGANQLIELATYLALAATPRLP
jgi:adenosylcobinamide-GDP ribazoletransferase